MDESESKNENFNGQKRRFSQEQYDFLKQCSEKGAEGIKEWNKWREDNYYRDVELEGGNFSGWYLKDVDLGTDREYGRKTAEVYLSKANFDKSNVECARFTFAKLKCASVMRQKWLDL